jgi:hypothetical protein
MIRGLIVAAAVTAGGMAFGVGSANAAPVSAGPSVPTQLQQSLIEKTQYRRYCRRWYRECRARWGGGRDFRRCMRRHGC